MTDAADRRGLAQQELQRAIALVELRRYADAIPLLHSSLSLDPENLDTHCYLGFVQRVTGQPKQALSTLGQALKLAPNHEWPHRLTSYVLRDLGNPRRALDAAREAQRLAPDVWQTTYTVAELYLSMHRLQAAWDTAETLQRIAPESVHTFELLGRIALARNQLLAAEKLCRDALALAPADATVHNLMGQVLSRQGRVKEAVESFERSLSVDPRQEKIQSDFYAGARELRAQGLLASARGRLARISPKLYAYYLHREGQSGKVLTVMFLWQVFLPLLAVSAVFGVLVHRFIAPQSLSEYVEFDVALGLLLLISCRFFGLWRDYLRASERTVQLITNLWTWLFNPVSLIIVGLMGLRLNEEHWIVYLLLVIVGITFTIRLAMRVVLGSYYALVSRRYERWLGLKARWHAWLRHSTSGRFVARVGSMSVNPFVYIAIGIAGVVSSEPESEIGWLLPVIFGTAIFLFRVPHYIRLALGRFAKKGV